MKKLCAVLLAVLMFASTAADAKGGRGFSGGRSFSRPSVAKTYAPKRTTVKRERATTPSTSTSGTPIVAQTTKKREEAESESSGGFWGTLFGSAVGSIAGNAIYDAITDDEKKEAAPPAPVEAKPAQ